MEKSGVALAIFSAVTVLEVCAFVARHCIGKHKNLGRSHNSPGGEQLGYRELQICGKQMEDNVEGLVVGPRLGYGSDGIVYHGEAQLAKCETHRRAPPLLRDGSILSLAGRWKGARVAVKVLSHDQGDKRSRATIAREVAISAALAHRNVVSLCTPLGKRFCCTFSAIQGWQMEFMMQPTHP